MTFEEWKQKNYKMWNTEQAYMLACEGTPEEENAVDKYSKMIFEAAQPNWTYCKDRYPTEVDGEVKKGCIGFRKNLRLVGVIGLSRDSDFGFEVTFNLTENHFESDDREVIAWMSLPEYKEHTK